MNETVLMWIGLIGGGAGVASIIVALINKSKTPVDVATAKAAIAKTQEETKRVKTEMEGFVVDTLETALNQMRLERDNDFKKLEAAEKRIEANGKRIDELVDAVDECEFEHGLTRVQLERALKELHLTDWKKANVYVLDDSETVVRVFSKYFQRMPVFDLKGFTIPTEFLFAVNKHRPEILIIDMLLGEITAEDILEEVREIAGYTPAVLIMSATQEYEARFKDTEVLFFFKDRHFIRKISKAILDHLRLKNMNN